MIIRKYLAKTEPEAVEQAKKELGDGVVILSVRSKKKKGIMSLISSPMVEITAALDDDTSSPGAGGASSAAAGAGYGGSTGAVKTTPQPVSQPSQSKGFLPDELIAQSIPEHLRENDPLLEKLSPTQGKSTQPAQNNTVQSQAVQPQPMQTPSAQQVQQQPVQTSTVQMPVVQTTPVQAAAVQTPAATAPIAQTPIVQTPIVQTPIAQTPIVQTPIVQAPIVQTQPVQAAPDQPAIPQPAMPQPSQEKTGEPFVKLLYDTMVDNEVSPENADTIIKEIEGSRGQGQSIDHLLANVYQKMILKFGKSVGIKPGDRQVKVIFFVGPTGVGKTTTIAKIASRFCVEEKKRVALLTTDTYRIAAAEQLSTYAKILGVPFRIVYTPGEMTGALSEYMNYDYVLVDTAGYSHNNLAARDNMSQFIHSVDGLTEREVFLVVSACTKYRDLLKIADSYRDITDYKLIFTKLDETDSLGNILNLKLHTGTEVSYVTAGQNVPDDIEYFNPQKTVKQLLGGKR